MIARVISTLGSVTQGVLSGRNSLHGLLQGLVCQIMVQGINVLTGVIVARLLGPDGRGAFVVMTLWPQLLSILLVAGLPVATIYNLRHHPSESANTAGALVVFGAIGVLAGGLIGQLLIPAVLTRWPADVVATSKTLIWFLFINIFTLLLRPCFLVKGDFRTYNALFLGPPATYLLLLLLVWGTVGLTALNASLCLLVSGLPVLTWGVTKVISANGISFSHVAIWLKRLSSFAISAGSADALVVCFNFADRLLLASLVKPGELGLYVVALSLARLLMLVPSSVSAVLLSSMSGTEREHIEELYHYSVRFGFWALLLLAVPLLALGHVAIVTVFGQDFAGAVPVFRILVVDSVVNCLTQIAAQSLMALRKPKVVSLSEAAGTTVAITLLLVLTPTFGLEGTAAALVCGSLTRASVVFGTLHRRCGVKLPSLLPGRADVAFIRNRL